VTLVAEGMGYDRRIGREFLRAGIGYGGSCFPKDVKAFIKIAQDYGVDFGLLREVEKINRRRIDVFMDKILSALWTLKDKRIAVWGLSFKPNTDDIREASDPSFLKASADGVGGIRTGGYGEGQGSDDPSRSDRREESL